MAFDVAILVIATLLCTNGWRRGLIASWRGPIAMAITTLIVQQLYVDFSTWLMSRLIINPVQAVFIGYLLLWFCIESSLEIFLSVSLKVAVRQRPTFPDRLGGIGYGLAKTVIIVLLPLIAISTPIYIPAPPKNLKPLVELPQVKDLGILTPGFLAVAKALLPSAGRFVASSKLPSFTPVYETPKGAEPVRLKEDDKKYHEQIDELLKQ